MRDRRQRERDPGGRTRGDGADQRADARVDRFDGGGDGESLPLSSGIE
jgi:hypothetical protein